MAGRDKRGGGAAAEARARLAALAAQRKTDRNSREIATSSGDEPKDPERISQTGPSQAPAIPTFGQEETESVDDMIAAAVETALEKARKEKESAIEAARTEERAAAEERLAAERSVWVEKEAGALKEQVEQAFETLHDRLSQAFAQALAPIAENAVRDKAVRRFASILDDLVKPDNERPAVIVRGPADLLTALRDLTAENAGLGFEEADETELFVSLDDTRVETVVGSWAADLARFFGETDARK